MDAPKDGTKDDKDWPKNRFRQFRSVWPELWALIKPRRGILSLGLVLLLINRLFGLSMPAGAKILVDDILTSKHPEWLLPLSIALVVSTLIQGASSFALTQLLSKAGQRLIAELRRKVQGHVGRLPVAYYDSNKTGQLVSRIMSDVE